MAWEGWVFPLPTLSDGRDAVVSDGFSAEETAKHRKHLGSDLMYRRLPAESSDLPRGTKLFYMPADTPVLAAFNGKIWNAQVTGYGHSVTIDHGNVPGIGPVVTFYQHMSSFARPWKKGDLISAGESLGIVGASLTGYALHHLHFELWRPTRDKAVDPALYMMEWQRRSDPILRLNFPEWMTPPEPDSGISTPMAIGIGVAGLFALGLLIAAASRDESV